VDAEAGLGGAAAQVAPPPRVRASSVVALPALAVVALPAVSRVALVAAFIGACMSPSAARAQIQRDASLPIFDIWPSCAGDGSPPNVIERARGPARSLQLSALASAWGAAYVGRDARISDGDAVEQQALYLGTARLGACGMVRAKYGWWSWNAVYEPYDVDESAQPDARSWGRMAAAEIGFAPWRWLVFSVGIRKVAFGYGHDEPLELMALPIRPYITTSVAPDRRAGITIDDDFGVAHIIIGVYEGARDLSVSDKSGMLITARLVAEPVGPVGNALSTLRDAPLWRAHPRFAVNASILYQYASGASNYALAADGAGHWGPVGMAGEYIYSSGTTVEGPVRVLPRPAPSRQGLWLGAAVMLWRPWLEVTARYDWMDNPEQAGQAFHAVAAGLNVYAYKKYLRIQTQYTHKFHYDLLSTVPDIQDDIFLISGLIDFDRRF
jgi:hypothetical protein